MCSWKYMTTIIFLVLFSLFKIAAGDNVADSKIKNSQLLAKKALNSTADQRENYVYKSIRELERAIQAEPDNPWPYYWKSIIILYFEQDSKESDKFYNKALTKAPDVITNYPQPQAYKTDAHLLSAFEGEFTWTEVEETKPIEEKVEEIPETPINPLDILNEMIAAKNFLSAESLYNVLIASAEYEDNTDLTYSGLVIKLNQNHIEQASTLLEKIQDTADNKSDIYKQAVSAYDSVLDLALISVKQAKREGEIQTAKNILKKWQPDRLKPTSPNRTRLLLEYSSVLLNNNETAYADSMLQLYNESGFKKTDYYKQFKKELAAILKQQEEGSKEVEVAEVITEEKTEKPKKTESFVTLSPPEGDIVKVVVNKINPATGRTQESEMWETYAPKKLATGESYKLTVNKKRERKAPKYIAVVGILATLLIMR